MLLFVAMVHVWLKVREWLRWECNTGRVTRRQARLMQVRRYDALRGLGMWIYWPGKLELCARLMRSAILGTACYATLVFGVVAVCAAVPVVIAVTGMVAVFMTVWLLVAIVKHGLTKDIAWNFLLLLQLVFVRPVGRAKTLCYNLARNGLATLATRASNKPTISGVLNGPPTAGC